MKKQLIFSLILLASISVFEGCSSKEEKKAEERTKYIIPDSTLQTIKIDTVRRCQLVDALTLTGSVDFNQDNQVSIYPLVSGVVQDIKVQLGDYVEKGQVLGVVKSGEMANYSNSLTTAEANLRVAKKNLDAQKDLYASGLTSQLDVTSAQSNYDQAVAQLSLAKRVLKINGDNTEGDYIIKAPISGFIVQKNVTNNTSIRTDNGTNLFTISDLKNVWVQANVYESNIGKIHMGDPVEITTVSYPDKVFKGTVSKILNVLDPVSKVIKVRVVVQNDDYALKPQMFARVVAVNQQNADAICIPASALVFDHSQYYVLKYNGKGDAVITPVSVLSKLGDRVYLASGISEGDKVVASETIMIYDALNN
jgi:cobalt-zinc-cadmium efflux system membrane fusion protein